MTDGFLLLPAELSSHQVQPLYSLQLSPFSFSGLAPPSQLLSFFVFPPQSVEKTRLKWENCTCQCICSGVVIHGCNLTAREGPELPYNQWKMCKAFMFWWVCLRVSHWVNSNPPAASSARPPGELLPWRAHYWARRGPSSRVYWPPSSSPLFWAFCCVRGPKQTIRHVEVIPRLRAK